ncbi:hypothetical protein D3C71_1948610 [compost metagenome]
MERRHLLYSFASLLVTPHLAGCGGSSGPATLNDIMAAQDDLTVIPPEEIDIAASNLDEIFLTEESLVY